MCIVVVQTVPLILGIKVALLPRFETLRCPSQRTAQFTVNSNITNTLLAGARRLPALLPSQGGASPSLHHVMHNLTFVVWFYVYIF